MADFRILTITMSMCATVLVSCVPPPGHGVPVCATIRHVDYFRDTWIMLAETDDGKTVKIYSYLDYPSGVGIGPGSRISILSAKDAFGNLYFYPDQAQNC